MKNILKACFKGKVGTRRATVTVLGLVAALSVLSAVAAVGIDDVPLSVPNAVPGNMVLVPSVEWPTVVTQANDPGLGDGSTGYTGYSSAAVTTCPTGYTLSGGSCQQSAAATGTCTDPYTLSGSSCTVTATSNPTCSSSGYTNFSSGFCRAASLATCTSSTYKYGPDSAGKCWTKSSLSGSSQSVCSGTGVTFNSGYCVKAPTYSCPSGYSPTSGVTSSTVCTKTGSNPSYSCPNGGTLSGTSCVTTATPTTQTNPYAGYFNSSLCYAYHFDPVEVNRYFYPVSSTTTDSSGNSFSCAGQRGGDSADGNGSDSKQNLWSGNFLNWATTQAIDTFRLALTGGYRVNRPADGLPQTVTITDSSGNQTPYPTSERSDVTYLEKANSDRWDSSYTKSRSVAASNSNVTNATPAASAANGFLTRIGALRNQMWFAPKASQAMGSARSYSDPKALALPIVAGDQAEPGGATGTGLPAIPYNPNYHTLPNANTTTVTNGTACGTYEEGCTEVTPLCNPSPATTWNVATGTCTGTTISGPTTSTQLLCTDGTNKYFNSTSNPKRCQKANNSSSGVSYTAACAASTNTVGSATTTIAVTFPTNSTPATGQSCTLTTTITTAIQGTATKQYQHTTYGINQVYAVSVRVKVCDGTLETHSTRDLCTQYGSNYKPEGLLQKNAKKTRYSVFSYLVETGVLRQGGVMRARQKLIGPVSDEETAGTEKPYPDRTGRIAGIDNPEWDPVTGMFINNPDSTDAQTTSNNIGGCGTSAPDGSQCVIQYSGVINYLNRFGQINTGQPTLKSYDNLSEMFYTAVRYLRGLANNPIFSALAKLVGNSDLSGTGSLAKYQNADGLPVIENWFNTGVNSAVGLWNASTLTTPKTVGDDGDPMLYQCQTTVMLGIGDTHTNDEDDQYSCDSVQGGTSSNCPWRSYLDAGSSTDTRLDVGGLAYWAHLNDVRTDIPNTPVEGGATGAMRGQTISTYWVDVVEQGDLYTATTNQYYNATKYGGYNIPLADWDSSGNAMQGGTTPPHDATWFTNNYSTWTSATANVGTILTQLANGNYRQPNNMFFGNNGQAMINGLTQAFNKIALELSGSGASLAANSTQLNTGTTTYQALYFSGSWSGDLRAYAVKSDGSINTTPLWTAVGAMPSAANRLIKTTSDGTASGVVEFKTSVLPAAMKTALAGSDTTAQGNMIDYLRGVGTNTAFRSRTTPLGDVVDSQPIYVGASDPNVFYGKTFKGSDAYATFAAGTTSRSKRVWVAANDGMLHAFNADCTVNTSLDGCAAPATGSPAAGAETFAYLPKAVIMGTGVAALKNLSDPQYGTSVSVPHQYFNDGEMTVADVYFPSGPSTGSWHTVLVGTTGRGSAKAIYALDVTDPTAPALLWEHSAADNDYIGQMIGKPIIAQTANGVWSVLIGNGYNSVKNSAALLQFTVSDGTLTVHVTDDSKTNNGLATPAVWLDDPTNGISTEAYAGDLLGNVWKFDLSSASSTGTVTFIALDSSSNTQPISSGILIGKDPLTSKVWIFFGTGRYLTQSDLRDISVQTWYGLIVEGTGAVSNSGTRSSLVQRTIAGEVAATSTTVAARAISTPANISDIDSASGWYMDLKVGNAAKGERMVTPNQFQGSLLLGTTRIPVSSDPCNPSGSGWVMVINPFTGAPPDSSFFDVNSNGTVGTDDKIKIGDTYYVAAGIGFAHAPNNPIFVGNAMLLSFDDASKKGYMTAGNVGLLKRLTWRELVSQ